MAAACPGGGDSSLANWFPKENWGWWRVAFGAIQEKDVIDAAGERRAPENRVNTRPICLRRVVDQNYRGTRASRDCQDGLQPRGDFGVVVQILSVD